MSDTGDKVCRKCGKRMSDVIRNGLARMFGVRFTKNIMQCSDRRRGHDWIAAEAKEQPK